MTLAVDPHLADRPHAGSAAGAAAPGAKPHPIREGLRWLRGNAPVRTLVLIILVFNVTWAAPWGVLVLYATDYLHMGAVGYGALTTASALGGLIGDLQLRLAGAARVVRDAHARVPVARGAHAPLLRAHDSAVVAFVIMFGFGVYAFVWGTISTTVRQRLVPMELQGRIASVNMVGVFGGLVIGQLLGGLIAQAWGLTAPWWFAFAGSAITLLLVWRSISHIAAAPPVVSTATGPVDVP